MTYTSSGKGALLRSFFVWNSIKRRRKYFYGDTVRKVSREKFYRRKNFFLNPEDRTGKKRVLFSIVNKPAVQDFRFRFYDKKPESGIAAAGVRYVKIEYRRVFGGSASEEG